VWDWIGKLREVADGGDEAALVTVTSVAGSTPAALGAKMIVLGDGSFSGTVGGGHLEKLVLGDAAACLGAGASKNFRYPLGATAGQCCGGVVEIFIEVLAARPRLYLFGVGHVGSAVARMLEGTPFRVHAIDEREDWLGSSKLPASLRRHPEPWDVFLASASWDETRTYVAIMTHRHDLDQDILEKVLDKPSRYVGLIGSGTKWNRFQSRLAERGVSPEKLARVRCPIGLDVGGKAPQEVAVSVCAELLQVHHGRVRAG